MNNIKEIEIFMKNQISLKEISIDNSIKDHPQYMTQSNIEAIDFDKIKTLYANNLSLSEEVASSVDALLIGRDETFFVEFKNGKMKLEKSKVKNKIRDSLLILCDLLDCTISYTRKNLKFILVYNESKNLNKEEETNKFRIEIANHLHNKAKTNIIQFGLEPFKTLYFKDIFTYTEKEFENFLNEEFVSK